MEPIRLIKGGHGMKRRNLRNGSTLSGACAFSLWISVSSAAPLGTAFTYQGQLKDAGAPAQGTFNMVFTLWNDPTLAGPANQIGATLTFDGAGGNPPPVSVVNGLFAVQLDFGGPAFNGDARWLQITVAGTTLSPRQPLKPAPYALALPGMRIGQNTLSPNVIGGYSGNTVSAIGATIGGGGSQSLPNSISSDFSTVSGGGDNHITIGEFNVIGGGWTNYVFGGFGANTIGGGQQNGASGGGSTVAGGGNNGATEFFATIGGGEQNAATGGSSTVCGGTANTASGAYSTVAGGLYNSAMALSATIAGGGSADHAAETGNRVTDDYGAIGGGGNNQAGNDAGTTDDAKYPTVSGGEGNLASGGWSFIGGGKQNTTSGYANTVAGGEFNDASGNESTIGGGTGNTASGDYSIIAGGGANSASFDFASIGGGFNNVASASASTVAGGNSNSADGSESTVGGGAFNTVSGHASTAAGGDTNHASSDWSTVGGGDANTASGIASTVPGGSQNTAAGDYGFAAGRRAKANHPGAFVWGDNTNANITSSIANQFTARSSGGVRFYSNAAATIGVQLAGGGNAWSPISDRNVKANIAPVNVRQILDRVAALPVATWNLISQDPSIRHMGPMAQDFYAAFGIGEVNTHISTSDADGVTLAAIQGLYELAREKENQLAELKQRNADLERRSAQLEARIARVEAATIRPASAGDNP
jgi:hypothetical protein